MTHTQEIYQILSEHPGYMTTKELAERLGMDDRELRGKGDDPGILADASREIFKQYGHVILRSMGHRGVKLSNDLAEIAAVKAEWSSQCWNTKRIVDALEEAEKVLTHKYDFVTKQLTLGLP